MILPSTSQTSLPISTKVHIRTTNRSLEEIVEESARVATGIGVGTAIATGAASVVATPVIVPLALIGGVTIAYSRFLKINKAIQIFK